MARDEQLKMEAKAHCDTEAEAFIWRMGAVWADNNPTFSRELSLSDAKEIWQAAHRYWLEKTPFPGDPQASVAWCYFMASIDLMNRKK